SPESGTGGTPGSGPRPAPRSRPRRRRGETRPCTSRSAAPQRWSLVTAHQPLREADQVVRGRDRRRRLHDLGGLCQSLAAHTPPRWGPTLLGVPRRSRYHIGVLRAGERAIEPVHLLKLLVEEAAQRPPALLPPVPVVPVSVPVRRTHRGVVPRRRVRPPLGLRDAGKGPVHPGLLPHLDWGASRRGRCSPSPRPAVPLHPPDVSGAVLVLVALHGRHDARGVL